MPPAEVKENVNVAKDKEANQTPIGTYASIQEFTKHGLGEIVQATKLVNAFPQGSARDLYCAYPVFGKIIDEQSERILGLISKVLKSQNVKGNIQRRQQDEQFEMLLECNDAILEQIGINLDEMSIKTKKTTTTLLENVNIIPGKKLTGATTAITPVGQGAGSWNIRKNVTNNAAAARFTTTKNIERPQLKFKVPPDNSTSTPFIPKLKEKPNSLKPLAILPLYDDANEIDSYLHPYEFELIKFDVKETQMERKTPQKPADLQNTPFVFVDTSGKLQEALIEIRAHKSFAVDLEHHSYRTFLGFTCLLQISTPSKDYLFDTLELRDDLHILNEVFTDPKILKIFHGSQMDIEWLQRDLAIYVVNMFDTHEAAKVLNFTRLSLAFLLKHYCNVEADKTLQLADWRVRPLSEELVNYARQDTHYLLYIYECINNEVLDASNQNTNLLRAIYQRSKELCMRRYQKPIMHADSHLEFYRKSKRIFNNRQLFALKEIYNWRDKIAREEDESLGYVLPNHMLLQIADILPREMQGILACCKPVPPLLRQHLPTLHQIILRAREQQLVKPILEPTELNSLHRKDYRNKLECPHDVTQDEEFRDDLPTLLNFGNKSNPLLITNKASDDEEENLNVLDQKSLLNIFQANEKVEKTPEDFEEEILRKAAYHIDFISPYQRYLAILPIVEKEKREEAARVEAANRKRKLCPEATTLPIVAKAEKDIKNETKNNDDMNGLAIKDYLKQKYEESVANKQKKQNLNKSTEGATQAKRLKVDVPVDIIDSDSSDGAPIEMPTTSSAGQKKKFEKNARNAQQQKNHNQQVGNKKAKLLQRKKQNKQTKSYQSSDKPIQTNFDYKNVDFKRFQGGAQRARGTQINPQFHGKGRGNKATNKKFNKLFTFGNVKNKK